MVFMLEANNNNNKKIMYINKFDVIYYCDFISIFTKGYYTYYNCIIISVV